MTNQVVRGSLTLSVWLDCASRRGTGYLDRAVDFSQQKDDILIYSLQMKIRISWPSTEEYERLLSIDEKSKPLTSNEIRGSAK
jgi:hypothetical protein